MSKLGKKLFIIFLVLVILSLLLVSIFINFSIGERFDDFINLQREENIKELASMISEDLENNNFDRLREIINNFSRTNQIPIWLEDKNGEIIYFSAQANQMTQMMRRMGMSNNSYQNFNRRPEEFPGQSRQEVIYLNGEKEYTLYWKEVHAENQINSNLYNYFKKNTYQAIIFSALIVIFLVIIISFILSKRITMPLIKLKNAALDVAQGNYDQNIESKGDDELSELLSAFNLMTKKLHRLEKIRKESASDLAHELRTPITTIKGYLEAVEDRKIEMNKEVLIELQEETDRMINLIEKLNDFSNAQNKVLNLKKEQINLSKIIKKVIKQKQSYLAEKNIDLKLEVKENLILKGDKDSLIQIFNNILENAVKYNKQNGEIKINSFENEKEIIIDIKDTGIGISREDLPYIFERFYRADKSRNSDNQGTGIGLAVTKELMEAHQGEIKVESDENGSLFKLRFPKLD